MASAMVAMAATSSSSFAAFALRPPSGAATFKARYMAARAAAVPMPERLAAVKVRLAEVGKKAALVASGILVALPALAEEAAKEAQPKGKIFDFNATLPIMVVQFLLLMVALDKIWFTPVSDFMDARDESIRAKLASVRDNSAEIKAMQDEEEAILKAARVEVSMELQKMRKRAAAELDEKLQEARARNEAEIAAAMKKLVTRKEEMLASLDSTVNALSEEIVKQVLPADIDAIEKEVPVTEG